MAARRPLTRARILAAALAYADAHGVEAISMRAIASTLGVEGMSLYNHVASKKALLDGLVDLVIQAAELPTGEQSAEAWIRGTAQGLRTLARRHARLVPLLSSRSLPLEDPASARPFEAGLAAFVAEGFSVPEAFARVQAIMLALNSMAQLEASFALGVQADEESSLAALPPAEFPLLHEVLGQPPGVEDFWSVLVEAMVVGLRPGS